MKGIQFAWLELHRLVGFTCVCSFLAAGGVLCWVGEQNELRHNKGYNAWVRSQNRSVTHTLEQESNFDQVMPSEPLAGQWIGRKVKSVINTHTAEPAEVSQYTADRETYFGYSIKCTFASAPLNSARLIYSCSNSDEFQFYLTWNFPFW